MHRHKSAPSEIISPHCVETLRLDSLRPIFIEQWLAAFMN